jgi:hypothetical protein
VLACVAEHLELKRGEVFEVIQSWMAAVDGPTP